MSVTFRTIHECGLELVGYTASTTSPDLVDDLMPVRAARASFGAQDKTGQNDVADIKLMKFLADEGHTSCFEHQSATFLVEVPLFIRSQIHRHRTFSYNEISRRYTAENLELWIPDVFRGQSKSNKQCSDGVIEGYCFNETEHGVDRSFEEVWKIEAGSQLAFYQHLLDKGVAREQARAVLPQSLLTRFYMTGNLRNWQHFIELRRDGHAQMEVQVVANRIAEELRKLWPESCKALNI